MNNYKKIVKILKIEKIDYQILKQKYYFSTIVSTWFCSPTRSVRCLRCLTASLRCLRCLRCLTASRICTPRSFTPFKTRAVGRLASASFALYVLHSSISGLGTVINVRLQECLPMHFICQHAGYAIIDTLLPCRCRAPSAPARKTTPRHCGRFTSINTLLPCRCRAPSAPARKTTPCSGRISSAPSLKMKTMPCSSHGASAPSLKMNTMPCRCRAPSAPVRKRKMETMPSSGRISSAPARKRKMETMPSSGHVASAPFDEDDAL